MQPLIEAFTGSVIFDTSKQLMEIFIQMLKLALLTHTPTVSTTQPWLLQSCLWRQNEEGKLVSFLKTVGCFRSHCIPASILILLPHVNSKQFVVGKNPERVIFRCYLWQSFPNLVVEMRTCWVIRIFSFLRKAHWLFCTLYASFCLWGKRELRRERTSQRWMK